MSHNQILLIDNYPRGSQTDRILRIQEIVNGLRSQIKQKTIHYSQLKYELMENIKGIIISGSSLNVSSFYYNDKLKEKFSPQIKLIKQIKEIPILAICFGHHLVSYSYGAQISRMKTPDTGGKVIFLKFSKTDSLIKKKNIPVDIHHRDFISPNDSEIQKNFEIKAKSTTLGYNIIQYMQHIEKPLFSLQFHPETHKSYSFSSMHFSEKILSITRQIGRDIIENFVWFCINKTG
ncbi:MAG: gamma-glutamyl-gamma-aminobutyrate hydrolase family protein [Candidatus Heimdallarchaeota archaeon]